MSNTVTLYIYDISGKWKSLLDITPEFLVGDVDRIRHTGLAVYGREYFYSDKGIENCEPGNSEDNEKLIEAKVLGKTSVPESTFKDYLRELERTKFQGSKYHFLRYNCITLSNELSQYLCDTELPDYLLKMAPKFNSSPIGKVVNFFWN